jgi:hypothetical protein
VKGISQMVRRRIPSVRRKLQFKRKDGWMRKDIRLHDYVEFNWYWKKEKREMLKYATYE